MATCPNCGTRNPVEFQFCGACGAPLVTPVAPWPEARKVVTIIFCDLVGSTALAERLDPETVRDVMEQYFASMRAALERHGGVVEKFVGDAVMAVFGVPRLHEDDAIRAVRAAVDMRKGLVALQNELEQRWGITLANRTGINTGEVVVGDLVSGQRLATGDAINVAARLEQAAQSGEILIGDATYRLVKNEASVEPVDPLSVKGKRERLQAYRLIDVRREATPVIGGADAPLIGRDGELVLLSEAFERALEKQSCELVTVVGRPVLANHGL